MFWFCFTNSKQFSISANIFFPSLHQVICITSCTQPVIMTRLLYSYRLWCLTSLWVKHCDILNTWFMSQSFMQDSLTALILLHLHEQLSQVIAQEVLLLGLQGCFIVIYCLCNSRLVSTMGFFSLSEWIVFIFKWVHTHNTQHKPWRSYES